MRLHLSRESNAKLTKAIQPELDSLLTQALSVAHNTPDIRKEKIEAIRAQIANGVYEIDALHIAEALIRENPTLFDE